MSLKQKLKELQERDQIRQEENKALTLKLVELEEEKGQLQLKNIEMEDQVAERDSEAGRAEKVSELEAELKEVKTALEKVSEELKNEKSEKESILSKLCDSSESESSLAKEKAVLDQCLKELADEKDNLKANLDEVEGYLLQEREKMVAFQIRMVQMEEEKEAVETKNTQLESALEDFYKATDKGKEKNEKAAVIEDPASAEEGEL